MLSAIAVAWLICALGAVAARERDFWPVMEASLFSWETREVVEPELVGWTRDGRAVSMIPAGFGLQPHQLHLWLAEQVGAPSDRTRRGDETLATLLGDWNRRHAENEDVVTVVLRLRRTSLPLGSGSSTETLLSWWEP